MQGEPSSFSPQAGESSSVCGGNNHDKSIYMNFSEALVSIKEGKVMGRAEWKNAKGVFLVPGSQFAVSRPPLLGILPEGTEVIYRPHIDMQGADGTIGTWAPSMVDILAEDWQEVV